MNGSVGKCRTDVSKFKGESAVADAAEEIKRAIFSVISQELEQLAEQTGLSRQDILENMCAEIGCNLEDYNEFISTMPEIANDVAKECSKNEDYLNATDDNIETLDSLYDSMEDDIEEYITEGLKSLIDFDIEEEGQISSREEEDASLWYYDPKGLIKRRGPYIYSDIEEKIVIQVPTFLFDPEEVQNKLKNQWFIEKLEKYRKKVLLREIDFRRLLNHISIHAEVMSDMPVKMG